MTSQDGKNAGQNHAARKSARMTWTLLALAVRLCVSSAAFADTLASAAGNSTGSIAISEFVEAEGARLYLEVRGERATAPLMIWLHGGPGGAERPLFRYFNSGLERHFLVAYYDQRGVGRSFDPEAPAASLNIAQHVADLDRVVDHLRSLYQRDRVLLVGHSWGSVVGMLFAKAHPEKVSGIVCVAPVVSFSEQHKREFAYDMEEAARRGDETALRDLHEMGPPPYKTPDPVIRLQRVSERYRGVEYQTHNHAAIVVEGIFPWTCHALGVHPHHPRNPSFTGSHAPRIARL